MAGVDQVKRKETDEKRSKGIHLPVSVMVVTVAAIIITSTAVIMEECRERARSYDNVLHPFFHLSAEPVHQNSALDELVAFEINAVPHIYLYEPCRLTVLDMYDGVHSSIEPDVICPGDVAILTVKGTIVGEFFREVVGVHHGQTDSVMVTLGVKGDE